MAAMSRFGAGCISNKSGKHQCCAWLRQAHGAPILPPMEEEIESRRRWPVKILLAVALLVLFGVWVWHGNPSDRPISQTEGRQPTLVEPDSELIPSIGLASTKGWKENEAPKATPGLLVTRFAEGLEHPRTMLTLPNGDVLVTETAAPPAANPGGVTGFFQRIVMTVVGAGDVSPNRIILLRDADGDGKAETRLTLREDDLDSPSGMAWAGGKLFVANHDAVLVWDFEPGATAIKGDAKLILDLPAGGNHWMRGLLLSEDRKALYIAIGSASNIAEDGTAREEGRAAIIEFEPATGRRRQFAGGLRNPNGMAWNPSTGELWTVVNERDMLGPDLVPDYLTNVPLGAQYGWPWLYWRNNVDWRVREPIPSSLNEYTRKPEYALGAHTAPLGLLFSTGGNLMGEGFGNGAFIARHGSWNRKPLVGYDVVFVAFDAHGNPVGMPKPVLSGFLTGDKSKTHGRPVWLAWDKTGALLVSDDTGGMIWRVHAPGARPSVRPAVVKVPLLPPRRSLEGDATATFGDDPPEQ